MSANNLDLSDLKEPELRESTIYECVISASKVTSDISPQACFAPVAAKYAGDSGYDSCSVLSSKQTSAEVHCIYYVIMSDGTRSKRNIYKTARSYNRGGQEIPSCPNSLYPEYDIEYLAPDGDMYCVKTIEPDNSCPEPTANDIPIFGTGNGAQDYCYTNPDGSQCKISTDSNGDYTLPSQYASQEVATCHDEPVDTPDPDPMPDVPETPDADDPTPDDNSEGDDSDKTADIDALNQINDNLTIINDSINTASDANSERLNLIKDNIDNSNLYLDSIEENTGKSLGALQQQTALLAEIRDKEDKDKAITASANRKTGGLNDFFTEEDKAQLVIELENKKQQLTDVYTQIQNDVTDRFNFSNSISGTYESRTINWKGHQKEVGAQRLSENLFKQLAPIVLLVCSIIALGILLWE